MGPGLGFGLGFGPGGALEREQVRGDHCERGRAPVADCGVHRGEGDEGCG